MKPINARSVHIRGTSDDQTFVKAPVQEALIPESYASESVVGWAMHQKYQNGLPLNRQEEDWKQLGVPLSRATLANWIIYCAENYLRHVYDYFHRQLRMRKYLMADETRVQVLNEPERNPETDSWMWLFRSGEDGLPPILLYHYTETRAKFHAASSYRGSADIWRRMDTRVIIICRTSNAALAGHM